MQDPQTVSARLRWTVRNMLRDAAFARLGTFRGRVLRRLFLVVR